METKLYDLLQEDEKLLWSGSPEQFETMSAVYKPALLRKIMMIVAGIVILSAWYISAALKNGVVVQPVAIFVCALPFLYSIYNDFSDAKKLRSAVVYAMTDRRMITLVDHAVSSITYEQVAGFRMDTDDDGIVSLVCGDDALKGKATSRRAAAVCGAHTNLDTNLCESYVMYGITAEADAVRTIAAAHMSAA